MDVYAQMGQNAPRTRRHQFTNFMTFVTFYDKIHVLQTLFKAIRNEKPLQNCNKTAFYGTRIKIYTFGT